MPWDPVSPPSSSSEYSASLTYDETESNTSDDVIVVGSPCDTRSMSESSPSSYENRSRLTTSSLPHYQLESTIEPVSYKAKNEGLNVRRDHNTETTILSDSSHDERRSSHNLEIVQRRQLVDLDIGDGNMSDIDAVPVFSTDATGSLHPLRTRVHPQCQQVLSPQSNSERSDRSSSLSPQSLRSRSPLPHSYKPLSRWSAERYEKKIVRRPSVFKFIRPPSDKLEYGRVVEFLSRAPPPEADENEYTHSRSQTSTRKTQARAGNRSTRHSVGSSLNDRHEKHQRMGRLKQLWNKDQNAPSRLRDLVRDLEIRCNRSAVKVRRNNYAEDCTNEDFHNANDGSYSGETASLRSSLNHAQGLGETSLPDNPGSTSASPEYEANNKHTRVAQLCDDDFLEHMVRETNRCASALKSSSERFVQDWYDITVHDRLSMLSEYNIKNLASLVTWF